MFKTLTLALVFAALLLGVVALQAQAQPIQAAPSLDFFPSDPFGSDGTIHIFAACSQQGTVEAQTKVSYFPQQVGATWTPATISGLKFNGTDRTTSDANVGPLVNANETFVDIPLGNQPFGFYLLEFGQLTGSCVGANQGTIKMLIIYGGYVPDFKPPEYASLGALVSSSASFITPTAIAGEGAQNRQAVIYMGDIEDGLPHGGPQGFNQWPVQGVKYFLHQNRGGILVTEEASAGVGQYLGGGLCKSSATLTFPYVTAAAAGIAENRPVYVTARNQDNLEFPQLLTTATANLDPTNFPSCNQ